VGRRAYLILEFVAIFLLIPVLLATGLMPARAIPLLIVVSLIICWNLARDQSFPRHWLFNKEGLRHHWKDVALRSGVLVTVLGAGVVWLAPALLFEYLKSAPLLWAGLMVLYPLLSVIPQEIVYRAFFFHRYGELFEKPRSLLLVNAAVFGFAHLVMGNWISVVLSGIGGLLFAQTYQRSKSLLLTSIEHAVFGNFIFTIGLGQYFLQKAA
jgi:hypothetical protein